MGAPQYEQAGADIGGTGTPNTIPRWTGASTLGDSVITQSGNNIGFGLGANTPISRWHALVPNSGASPTASDWTGSFSANGDYRSGFGFQFSAGGATGNRVTCLVSNGTTTGQTVVWTADGAGNVGIGTASPAARLDVLGSTSAGYFRFKGGNTSAGYGEFQNSSGTSLGLIGNGGGGALSGGTVSDLVLRAEANLLLAIGNTERARIDSAGNFILNTATTGATIQAAGTGQGLKLPATPGNTDPNTLDCYADGGTANSGGVTWTPTLTFGGATTGVTYQTQVGRYTRVGNMVFATCYFVLTSKGTATGNVKITGLPTSSNTTSLFTGATVGYFANITSTGQVMGYMSPNDTGIILNQTTAVGANTALTDANFANNSAIIVTIAYPVT